MSPKHAISSSRSHCGAECLIVRMLCWLYAVQSFKCNCFRESLRFQNKNDWMVRYFQLTEMLKLECLYLQQM